jgi:anti-sigma B factor antagonist
MDQKNLGEHMIFEEIIKKDVAVLTLHGNMLEPDTCKLADKVKAFAENNICKVVIDLNGVKRMNSAYGLGVLMTCFLIMNRAGGELRLANLNEKERRILEVMKLDHVFQIYDHVERAINATDTLHVSA